MKTWVAIVAVLGVLAAVLHFRQRPAEGNAAALSPAAPVLPTAGGGKNGGGSVDVPPQSVPDTLLGWTDAEIAARPAQYLEALAARLDSDGAVLETKRLALERKRLGMQERVRELERQLEERKAFLLQAHGLLEDPGTKWPAGINSILFTREELLRQFGRERSEYEWMKTGEHPKAQRSVVQLERRLAEIKELQRRMERQKRMFAMQRDRLDIREDEKAVAGIQDAFRKLSAEQEAALPEDELFALPADLSAGCNETEKLERELAAFDPASL